MRVVQSRPSLVTWAECNSRRSARRRRATSPSRWGNALAQRSRTQRASAGDAPCVDTARRGAYREMLDRGFRTSFLGIRMNRPDDLGYGRHDAYVIDDLR
jgi:hypothetical protein